MLFSRSSPVSTLSFPSVNNRPRHTSRFEDDLSGFNTVVITSDAKIKENTLKYGQNVKGMFL